MLARVFIYTGMFFVFLGTLDFVLKLIPKRWFRKKIEIEIWQFICLLVGFLLVITGLIIFVFWRRGFIQLKWLQCPEFELPFA